ncbi:MAG: HAD-IB family phosphatase [Actinomycetota bacterium]
MGDVREGEQQAVDLLYLRPLDVRAALSFGLHGSQRDPFAHVLHAAESRRYPAPMLPVRSVLVDFDGTASRVDVSEQLLVAFGDPSWSSYDDAFARGDIALREAIQAQDRMLNADRDTLVAFALEHGELDPTFAPFVGWCETNQLDVAIVSDGFAFYIEPTLRAAGLGHLTVITNEQAWRGGRPDGLWFVNAHPTCVGCGTCKMQSVLRYRERGPVAFVGDGQTDRYGALYADVTFAKLELIDHCQADGVPFVMWDDFDDVRRALETTVELPGPVAPIQCPGWTIS